MLRYHSVVPEGEALLTQLLGYIHLHEGGSSELPPAVHITEIYRGRNVLYRVECPEGDFTIKHFGRLSLLRRLYYGWTNSSKARRSLLNAVQLSAYGIATPEPIGYAEERSALGGLEDSYYVTRYLAFTGAVHEDLSPGNIPYMYDRAREEYTFMLVDLNRMHFTATPLSLRASIRNLDRLFAHPHATETLGRAYAEARGWDPAVVQPALEAACDSFWLHRLPKLALRYAQRAEGMSAPTFLRHYNAYLRWRRLRHLCPVGSWQRALHARESAFYTRYLEVEDVRRALAKRENYPHTPLS